MPRRKPNKARQGLEEEDDGEFEGFVAILRSEISDLSRVLNTKLALLEAAVKEVREGQEGIRSSISFLDEKFEAMKKTTERLERDNATLQKENKALQGQLDALNRQVLDLDQYHRRMNLEITGIPEKKDENAEKIVLQVAQMVNPNISVSDIDIAHRLGKPRDGDRPRPIIVRFSNRRSRNAVYDERRKLKNLSLRDLGYQHGNGKIFVNENLIPSTRELLGEVNKARKNLGFKFLWTYNGKIFVKKNEAAFPIIINSKDDICKMK